jgi:polysaccharide export outer membrane protein
VCFPRLTQVVPKFDRNANRDADALMTAKRLLCGVVILALLVGCSSSEPKAVPEESAEQAAAASDSRIDQLWSERQKDSFSPDFAIGPGDVMEVSAPDVDEIKDRTERVSADNTINLPVAGVVRVGGLTEAHAREAIKQALSKYIKDPQIDVFVKEYTSRQVAVIGMVNKPGLYSLNSRSQTILDMVGQAGGMNATASSAIIFIPASAASTGNLSQPDGMMALAGTDHQATPASGSSQSPAAASQTAIGPQGSVQPVSIAGDQSSDNLTRLLRRQHAMSIPVTDLARGSHFDLLVRPGDVIIVPNSGNVMVQGWVKTPGAYVVTNGLTTLGAITAAGGQMFSSNAKVLRANSDGQLIAIPVDLAKVEKGEQPDVPVQGGDVVIIEKSAVGAVPYLAYTIFDKLGTGLAFAAPAI